MSASAGGEEIEVNLTPLLDLVLQLIMFFMITLRLVHFEQSNEEIDLPKTHLSLPSEDEKKKNRFPVWVNMDKDGTIVGLYEEKDKAGKPKPLVVPIKKNEEDDEYKKLRDEIRERIQSYFADRKKDFDRQARVMGLKEGDWKVGVVIRADHRCRYEQVYTIMDLIKQENFDFWQISVENLAG